MKTREANAAELRLIQQLNARVVSWDDPSRWGGKEPFDPWLIFDFCYGSYSKDFDDMAIEVLEDLRDGTQMTGELHHFIFKEVLCCLDLCSYGTSPRWCFPNHLSVFEERLPELIEKWKEYRELQWG